MRIIKLAKQEFKTLEDVNYFFKEDLPTRDPKGKFRIPKGHIAKNALIENEKLLFVYENKILYIALSGSKLLDNQDVKKSSHPRYFQIDMDSLKKIEPYELSSFETAYHLQTKEEKKVVGSQGWNIITDEKFIKNIWSILTKR